MLGGSMFRDMEEDPFFAAHREQMRQMHSMFSMDPFRGFGMRQPMLEDRGQRGQGGGARQVQPYRERNPMDPFDAMGMFGGFHSMFGNMNRMMGDMQRTFESARSNPDSHSYVQSSYYSYSNTGDGAPKVYQASSSTRTAPGGVKETRKAMRDSEKGIEKMAVGHHIRDRAHIVEKSRGRDGHMDENQELINLDENEAESFDHEWREKTRGLERARGLEYQRRGERSDRRALPEPRREKPSYRDRERRHKD